MRFKLLFSVRVKTMGIPVKYVYSTIETLLSVPKADVSQLQFKPFENLK